MQYFNFIGFQKSIDTRTKDDLCDIACSTRKHEYKKKQLMNNLAKLEAHHPRTMEIATSIHKLRTQLKTINAAIDKNENATSLIERAQQPLEDLKHVELIGLLHRKNARAADPMRVATLIENSNAAQEIVMDSQEMLDDNLRDPQLQIDEQDNEDLAAIMAETEENESSHLHYLPSIPSSQPTQEYSGFYHLPPPPPSSPLPSSSPLPLSSSSFNDLEERLLRLASFN